MAIPEISKEDASPVVDPKLQQRFDKYRIFVRDMGNDPDARPSSKDITGFQEWWDSLQDNLRESFARDFERGYAASIAAGQQEVREAMEARRLNR